MRDHRSLEAWKEARRTNLLVLQATKEHWKPWASAVFAQLQRAALSVQLNIAEGATFGPSPSYSRHLAIAYGSAVETVELVELARDGGVLSGELGEELRARSRHTQCLLLGLLKRHRPFGTGPT